MGARTRLPTVAVVLSLVAGGCGQATDDAVTTDTSAAAVVGTLESEAPGTTASTAPRKPARAGDTSLDELLGRSGGGAFDTPDVIQLGALDLPAGEDVRIPFVVLDKGGTLRPPDGDRAEVWLARTPEEPAVGPFEARVETIAAEGVPAAEGDIGEVLVVHADIPRPGGWLMVATYTVDGVPSGAHVGLSLLAKARSPAVGEAAPRSETPTLRSTGGDVAALSTAPEPQRSLLEHSVAESLDDRVPFVLAFATPRFCQSRLCGPVVEIVAQVQRELRGTPMRFLHVEVFEDNDPAKGTNRWFREWRLLTEPWVFVVGADGRVKAKFEGSVSPRELEQAARAAL